jgi:hypothetical protein
MYLATEEIFSIYVKGLQNVQREGGHVIRKKKHNCILDQRSWLRQLIGRCPDLSSIVWIKSQRFLYL